MAPSSKVWQPEYAIFGIGSHLFFAYLNSIAPRTDPEIKTKRREIEGFGLMIDARGAGDGE